MANLIRKLYVIIALIGVISIPDVSLAEDCRIRFGMEEGGFDFTPLMTYQSTQASFVEAHVSTKLVEVHHGGKIVLRGASAYTIDKEAKNIVFKLDTTCGWSDGTTVTAHEYQVGIANALLSVGGAFNPGIRGLKTFLETKNPADLAITAPTPNELHIGYEGSSDLLLVFLSASNMSPVPLHMDISPSAYFALPLEERVTSGPYLVDTRGEQITILLANPHYCSGSMPEMQKVELHEVGNTEQQIRKFVQGKLDVLRFLPIKQLQGLLKRNEDLEIQFLPLLATSHEILLINASNPALSNILVRQAIEKAIDYRAFAQAGTYDPTQTRMQPKGYVVPYPPYTNYSMEAYFSNRASDVSKARELMELAGYSDDNRVKINITTYPIPAYETSARRIASMLGRAYFDIEFITQESTKIALEVNDKGDFDLFLRGEAPSIADTSAALLEMWSASIGVILEGMETRDPLLQRAYEELPALLERTTLEDDSDERIAVMAEAESLMGETKLVIPIFDQIRNLTVQPGFKVWGDGFEAAGGAGHAAQFWTKDGCKSSK